MPTFPRSLALTDGAARWSFGGLAAFVVIAVTLLRYAVLLAAGHNLFGDEAQYWSWSRALDFGYFSKPPMIAWVIGATTALCGDGEPCVRAASPLFHALTSGLVYVLARALYDARAAFWSCLAYLTLPGVSLSAGIISTDVPLLLCWAVALVALQRLLAAPQPGWAALLGLALGLGLLSKYAMMYFALCAALYFAFTPTARASLRASHLALATMIAAVIYAPNLIWNLAHGGATYGHTADNVNWTGSLAHPVEALKFLGSQLGVFGPILFVALLARLAVWLRAEASPSDRFLLFFTVPVIAVIVVQSFVSRALANWAATAYVAGAIVVTAWLLEIGRTRLVQTSLAVNVVPALALYVLAALPHGIELPRALDPFARARGWDVLARELDLKLRDRPGAVLICDDRTVMAEILYYLRDRPVKIAIWDNIGPRRNHYRLTAAWRPELGPSALLVTRWAEPRHILDQFASVRPAGSLAIPIRSDTTHQFNLFDLEAPR